MKRLTLGLVATLSFGLWGCPIYGDSYADLTSDCSGPGCVTPQPTAPTCRSSADCEGNATCGADRLCHPGDCTFWGCSDGYACVIGADSLATCEPGSGSGGGGAGGGSSSTGVGGGGSSSTGVGGGSSSSSTGSGGAGPTYCGNPADCAPTETCSPDTTCHPGDCATNGCIHGFSCDATTKSCKPTNPASCGADADCSALGAGYACVSGLCAAPADQCSDQTQCPRSGDKCVAGKCTAGCVTDSQCPTDFTCDAALGICSVPAQSCTLTSDCGSATKVCVDGACVPRSPDGTCPAGEVWSYSGCIPSESASFTCAVDGVQGACAAGSICLHHSCYIACGAPHGDACDSLPSFNVCKSVTTSSGSHDVCGSNANLGGECDPTAGITCSSGKVCIDGFCR